MWPFRDCHSTPHSCLAIHMSCLLCTGFESCWNLMHCWSLEFCTHRLPQVLCANMPSKWQGTLDTCTYLLRLLHGYTFGCPIDLHLQNASPKIKSLEMSRWTSNTCHELQGRVHLSFYASMCLHGSPNHMRLALIFKSLNSTYTGLIVAWCCSFLAVFYLYRVTMESLIWSWNLKNQLY